MYDKPMIRRMASDHDGLPARLRRLAAAALFVLAPAACAGGGDRPAASAGQPRPGASPAGNYLAGRHAQNEQEPGLAGDFYQAVLGRDPENVDLVRRAFLLYVMEGRMDQALPLARRHLALNPKAPVAALALVVDDIRGGRFGEAEQGAAALPEDGVNVFLIPILRAWALVGQKKPDAALAALDPLTKSSGFNNLYDLHAGLINDAAGHPRAAVEHLAKVAAAPDGGMSLRMAQILGSLYERLGERDKARAAYQAFLKDHSGSRLFDRALNRLERGEAPPPVVVTSAADGAAEALFGIAGSLRQRTARETALVFGRFALHLRRDFPLAQVMVADLLEADGRIEAAVDLYRGVDQKADVSWSARLRAATLLDRLERTEEAVATLKDIARRYPGDSDPLIALGDILRNRQRFAEAVEAYDEAMARVKSPERQHWSLLYSRGIALERSKHWERAEKDFLKALEFEPEQPFVLNYLGYSWVDKGLNLEQARRMIEKAVELRPNDGYIVDSLGWALYRVGDFDGAVRHLERAVELRPEDPVINDHLGDAYWQVGRRLEARFQWRRALGMKPEADMIGAIEDKLRRGLTEATGGPKRDG
jgi:tetratricopeptide (TPR) repeat protein